MCDLEIYIWSNEDVIYDLLEVLQRIMWFTRAKLHEAALILLLPLCIVENQARSQCSYFHELDRAAFYLTCNIQRLVNVVQRDGDYLISHAYFVKRIASAFETFVESTERECLGKYVNHFLAAILDGFSDKIYWTIQLCYPCVHGPDVWRTWRAWQDMSLGRCITR